MLTDLYKQTGVPIEPAFGTDYPSYFLHPLVEYNALVDHAGIIDLTHRRVLSIAGNDRAGFLNSMLTNNIVGLETGNGCHTMITTVKGKIVAELFVFARTSDHLVLVSQGDVETALTSLEKHIINEDVSITDVSDRFGVLGVEGPDAGTIVKRLFGPGPVPKTRLDIVDRDFEGLSMPLINNTCTGTGGYHIVVPSDQVERIRELLIQAARGSDGLPIGLTAWNIHRVEHGIPWYGVDFSNENFPQEARLDHTVDYEKGCFLGQETLGRIHNRGDVNWLLVGLTDRDANVAPDAEATQPVRDTAAADMAGKLEKLTTEINELMSRADENGLRDRASSDLAMFDLSTLYPPGTDLLLSGEHVHKPVGRITSAVVSPQLGGCLLLAILRRELVEPKAMVELPGRGAHEALSVVDLPLKRDDH